MREVFVVFAFLVSVLTMGCKMSTGCFDQNLYDQNKGDACPENCPGVKGCDGETYCNECIPNSIRL